MWVFRTMLETATPLPELPDSTPIFRLPEDVDPLGPGRGIILGVVIGLAMWGAAFVVWWIW